MPASRAARMTATPSSLLMCSNVIHEPSESTETSMPEAPRARCGSTVVMDAAAAHARPTAVRNAPTTVDR